MSAVEEKWGWQFTQINSMKDEDIKILLQNRNYVLKDAKNQNLKKILKTQYFVEDENLPSFEDMTIKQLKPELKLRKLQYKYGGKHGLKQDMLTRLKHHKVPSSPSNIPEIGNKILVHGYIRENEIVLEHGLFIPYYLKEIIVKYCKSGDIAFCLTTKIPNYFPYTGLRITFQCLPVCLKSIYSILSSYVDAINNIFGLLSFNHIFGRYS